jgi:hypothetical protein
MLRPPISSTRVSIFCRLRCESRQHVLGAEGARAGADLPSCDGSR